MKFYYFGCGDRPGHYMFSPGMVHVHGVMYSNPWGMYVDGGLCPHGLQVEGKARIHKKDGWTVVAFWDRSVDSRPGSNSVFLSDGDLTFSGIIDGARELFPEVFARFKFHVAEAA